MNTNEIKKEFVNTETINNINVNNVRYQIDQKKGYKPFYATLKDGSSVLTDYDQFPYSRYFRGVPESYRPIVAEREAGWRPIHNNCYKVEDPNREVNIHKNCFESACSVVYPCYPNYAAKYSDRDAFNVMLNNACIVEYR
jgi:hypothetical protein